MQFQTDDEGTITVTLENKVFGKETMDPTIVITGSNAHRNASISVNIIKAVAKSDSKHKMRYFNGVAAVLKEIMERDGFNSFIGGKLVAELYNEVLFQKIIAKRK